MDTGFLYALAYKDDRLFETANDIHDLLVEHEVPIYSNVISRMELINLIFRKQATIGCIEGKTRSDYLAALKKADQNEYDALIAFARS